MKKFKILIVDDSQKFTEGLKELLLLGNADKISHIDIVNTGQECLQFIHSQLYDIIFMDYEMPDMNGAEVTEIISQQSRYMKIIALSFHSDLYTINKMIKSGARNYLIKDKITPVALSKCLNS